MKLQTHRLTLEPLEDRMLMSTCTVTRLGDVDGGNGMRGSLRHCINQANNIPGPDVIDIKVTGTINLKGVLPDLKSDIDIRGPGADKLNVRRDTGGNYRILRVTGVVSISGLTISNGRVESSCCELGGGIESYGSLTIDSCTIRENQVHVAGLAVLAWGGGIYSSGPLTIRNSTLSGNKAYISSFCDFCGSIDAAGGGVAVVGSVATIENSTIANNTVEAYGPQSQPTYAWGGGIYFDQANGVVRNSTVSGNIATGGGSTSKLGAGIYSKSSSSLLIQNSIVSLNVGGGQIGGSHTGDHNFIGGDAMLGPLQCNGGPTQTMALLPGSPAIDTGDNTDAPEFDQRGAGYPRIVNDTIDIGAFEVQSPPLPGGGDQLAILSTVDWEEV